DLPRRRRRCGHPSPPPPHPDPKPGPSHPPQHPRVPLPNRPPPPAPRLASLTRRRCSSDSAQLASRGLSTLSPRPRAPTKQLGPSRPTARTPDSSNSPRGRQAGEKGPDARRRPKAGGEAESFYVEPATKGANEAAGP